MFNEPTDIGQQNLQKKTDFFMISAFIFFFHQLKNISLLLC